MRKFFLFSLLIGAAVAIYRKLKADRTTSTYDLDAGTEYPATTGTSTL